MTEPARTPSAITASEVRRGVKGVMAAAPKGRVVASYKARVVDGAIEEWTIRFATEEAPPPKMRRPPLLSQEDRDYIMERYREKKAAEKARRALAKERAYRRTPEYRRKVRRERIASDPIFRLNIRVASRVRVSLRGKSSKRLYHLLGYTLDALKAHLEARFTDGMTWENMGRWHIDHIRPLSSFAITGPDCPEFKAAWALENLQPLWAADNLRKGAKWSP